MRDGLAGQGYDVLTAESGEQAFQAADTHAKPIAVLLVDVVMPTMNGPEVAERMRSARPELKVVFMSGFSRDIVIVHGIKEGEPFVIKRVLLSRDKGACHFASTSPSVVEPRKITSSVSLGLRLSQTGERSPGR